MVKSPVGIKKKKKFNKLPERKRKVMRKKSSIELSRPRVES